MSPVIHYSQQFSPEETVEFENSIYDLYDAFRANHELEILLDWSGLQTYIPENSDYSAKESSASAPVQRELQVKRIEHTETYKTLEKYGFLTYDYLTIDRSLYISNGSYLGVVIEDDGTDCILERRYTVDRGGIAAVAFGTPDTFKITNGIKEILAAYEGKSLRHVLILIECKDSEKRNVLLQNAYGRNMLGDWIQGTSYSEADKDFSLEANFQELTKNLTQNGNFYDSPNLKWYITTY